MDSARRGFDEGLMASIVPSMAQEGATIHLIHGIPHTNVDRISSKSGPQVLTLITCGGSFNRSLNSYTDNIVVYASPMEG